MQIHVFQLKIYSHSVISPTQDPVMKLSNLRNTWVYTMCAADKNNPNLNLLGAGAFQMILT